MQMSHFREWPLSFPLLVAALSGSLKAAKWTRWPLWFHLLKVNLFLFWISEVNVRRCAARWTCWSCAGTCLCRTLCRTEQIRMKYWVHLWISGAERPLVGASACIFSWWKPLDGSFLLAASLNSESQKCNASWQKKKKKWGSIEVELWRGFSLLWLKSRWGKKAL